MPLKASTEVLPELAAFLAPFAPHFQRSEGRDDLERYCTGLLSDLRRKNPTTIAASIPGTHPQRLQELTTAIQWDEQALNGQRVEWMGAEVRLGDGVLIFDDTGFAKQGKHSVGVARQYSGTLGKVGNCQVAVTSVYADPAGSWPVDIRLYLPKEWTDDPVRCAQAGVPATIGFQTKPAIALDLLEEADRRQVPYTVIGADADYGGDSTFLAGLEERQKRYVVAIPGDFHVEVKGQAALGSRRADTVLKEVAPSAWKTIRWREGTKGWLRKKFVAIRAYRTLAGVRQQLGWLIGERPARGQSGDWKYYFSNLPKTTPLTKMVDYAHRRWHIEAFHEGSKSLLGWDDYQGRLWTGFHRQATIIMLTYSFLRWQAWHQRQTAPRSPGRPRDPFSPSAGSPATTLGGDPSTDRRGLMGDGGSAAHTAANSRITAPYA
jgi:SRSO17 transposase